MNTYEFMLVSFPAILAQKIRFPYSLFWGIVVV